MNAYPLSSWKSKASIKWRKNPDLFFDRHPQRETRKFYRGVNRNAGRDQINPGSKENQRICKGALYIWCCQRASSLSYTNFQSISSSSPLRASLTVRILKYKIEEGLGAVYSPPPLPTSQHILIPLVLSHFLLHHIWPYVAFFLPWS